MSILFECCGYLDVNDDTDVPWEFRNEDYHIDPYFYFESVAFYTADADIIGK